MTRRTALAWLTASVAFAAGVVLGRGLPRDEPSQGGTACPPNASASPIPVGSLPDGPLPFLLNLRHLKPYDLSVASLYWMRTNSAGTDLAYSFAERETASISLRDAVVLLIQTPSSYGPITDVSITAASGGPVPLLERLRDVGVAADLAEIAQAQRPAPVDIGDMWLMLPRDQYWRPGTYSVRVQTTARDTNFGFTLV